MKIYIEKNEAFSTYTAVHVHVYDQIGYFCISKSRRDEQKLTSDSESAPLK